MRRWGSLGSGLGRWLDDQDGDLGFGGESFSDRADFFRGFEFDGDAVQGEFERLGEGLADGEAEVAEFGALDDDRGVDVGDAVAAFADQGEGVFKEDERVAVLPLGVGIGEVEADVAKGGGAEEGVCDGVGEDVGVGVAIEAEVTGDGDAAEDERAALHDAVVVPAETGTDVHRSSFNENG